MLYTNFWIYDKEVACGQIASLTKTLRIDGTTSNTPNPYMVALNNKCLCMYIFALKLGVQCKNFDFISTGTNEKSC